MKSEMRKKGKGAEINAKQDQNGGKKLRAFRKGISEGVLDEHVVNKNGLG